MNWAPYLWFIAGALFIVAELFTSGFVLVWFGIGALVAGLMAILHIGIGVQMVAFLVISSSLTIASRTIFERFFMRRAPGKNLRTGVEALPGKIGVVVEPSRGALNEAAVKVFGAIWTAYPAAGELPLDVGEQVEVERVEGATLYVRRVSRELPWRQEASNHQLSS
jgi:membrane protein implicated in regulation of membrane protease activity